MRDRNPRRYADPPLRRHVVIAPYEGSQLTSPHDPVLPRPGGDLDPVADAQLALDRRHVALYRAQGNEQLGGDLLVTATSGDGPDDPEFACWQR